MKKTACESISNPCPRPYTPPPMPGKIPDKMPAPLHIPGKPLSRPGKGMRGKMKG